MNLGNVLGASCGRCRNIPLAFRWCPVAKGAKGDQSGLKWTNGDEGDRGDLGTKMDPGRAREAVRVEGADGD